MFGSFMPLVSLTRSLVPQQLQRTCAAIVPTLHATNTSGFHLICPIHQDVNSGVSKTALLYGKGITFDNSTDAGQVTIGTNSKMGS